jgi:hypothetical protein
MKTVNALEIVPAVMKQIPGGAFLTVAAKRQQNVMTRGEGVTGVMANDNATADAATPRR